jgi:ribonuclease D
MAQSLTVLTTAKAWLEHVAGASPEEEFALDLETTGLSPWLDNIAVVGLYREATNTAGILHYPKLNSVIEPELIDWLSSPERQFIVFNGVGFDWYFLHKAGVNIFSPQWYDAMVAEGVTVKAARRDVKISLDASYKRRLGKPLKEKIDHRTWQLPTLTPEQLSYVAADIQYLPALRRAQLKDMKTGKQIELKFDKIIERLDKTLK